MAANTFPEHPVLLIDDEIEAIRGCTYMLEANGIINLAQRQDSRKVMPYLEKQDVSVILLDLSMPHVSGEELLNQIKTDYPHIPVVIITGQNDIETAIRCMKSGAFDYLVKPVEEMRMIATVTRAVEMKELQQEYSSFKDRVFSNKIEHPDAFSEIFTNNASMHSIFQYAETIAVTNRPVLITGETGVGKELLARAIHTSSKLQGSFVAVNVAGLDDTVFADTLFGHMKGAFTGADTNRAGLIEQAAGGTLFLDEIGDLSPVSQIKLLRLLQDFQYFPLGSDVPKTAKVRILVATNKDVEELHTSGQFRPDLYYRL